MERLHGDRAGEHSIRVNDQEANVRHETNLAPVHPGEILREEFLSPMGISINALARALRVPPSQVSGIVNEKRGISALMALRLARYFGCSAGALA